MKFCQDFTDIHVLCGNLAKDAVLLLLDDRGHQITTYSASPGAVAIAKHLILSNGG